MDLISALPDHVIAHIISFLPTEEAVRTSVLSSRWKNIWKDISSIRLLDPESDPGKFVNLVYHVLHNCGNFQSFQLYCRENVDLTHVNAWISRALSCKIEKMILNIHICLNMLPTPPMPECILACSTLVTLKLHSCCDIQIPESIVCFPHLKSLEFRVILPHQVSVIHKLLSSCPVLEELSLSGLLGFGDVENFDICVPTLKKLKLSLEYIGYDDLPENDIVIDTPNLRYLSIMDDSLSQYVVKNLSRVRHVDVMYDASCLEFLATEYVNGLLELLKGIAATKYLTLHFPTVDVMGSAVSYTWPKFWSLKMLDVRLNELSGWTGFANVLHSAPYLKVLILDLERMEMDDIEEHQPLEWTPPDRVPDCLLKHLQIIGIKWFGGNEDQLQAVEYFLKNAEVLKRMMIGFHSNPVTKKVVKKLLMFPKASRTCKVRVCDYFFLKTYRNKIAWGTSAHT